MLMLKDFSEIMNCKRKGYLPDLR